MKVIIIGGVAGGASAAARLRRLDENAEIVIYERTNYISYANCGLPYYLSGVINNKENLTLQTPEGFYKRFKVVAKILHEVQSIDTVNKTVEVLNIATGERFTDNYDKLVLAPGAKTLLPSFYKLDERVFTLRTVEDALKIREYIDKKLPKSAVVIGGGFIGVETAENLKLAGLEVTIIQLNDCLLGNLDHDMVSFVHANLRKNGINLLLKRATKELICKDDSICVELDNDLKINTDMVVFATGVVPDGSLAKGAGLQIGLKGSIKVNSKMQTSNPDVYACGDAVEISNFITKQEDIISLAGPANKQGRIVADNICGISSEYKGSQGSSIIKIFDATVATTGINEKQAKAMNLKYEKVILAPPSHASYYPGGTAITIKILYEKCSMEILGAQIVGYDGVDKRIDVIATAIRAKMKASELKDLDLSYAPPYSSAKDPVNMAGFIIDNIENGLVKQFYYEDILELRNKKDVILVDTRTPLEYSRGFAEGFINIPLDELRDRVNQLDKNKKIYIMCQSGHRSYVASRILSQNGYECYNFAGGYRLYSSIYSEQLASKECFSCGMDK